MFKRIKEFLYHALYDIIKDDFKEGRRYYEKQEELGTIYCDEINEEGKVVSTVKVGTYNHEFMGNKTHRKIESREDDNDTSNW